jgi:hypothetical protein
MAINLTGGLPPEILGQQQQLNRQQQMAQMLMQQGQQMPQGQMVSGRYVQPSIFASLAPLAQMYAGQKIAERGDKQALDLAKQLRQTYGDELKEFRNLMQGREELAPEQAGPTQTGQAIPQEMVRGAPNVQGAYDFASRAYNPALQQIGLKKLSEGPIKVGVDDVLLNPIDNKVIFQGAGKQPDSIKYAIAVGQLPPDPKTWNPQQAALAKQIVESKTSAGASKYDFSNILGKGAAGEVAPMLVASKTATSGAIQQADAANRILQSLDTNKIFTGAGANQKLQAAQVGQMLGITSGKTEEIVANTRQAIQGLAQLTLQGRKQMRGEGAITESEGALAQRAMSGDVSLTAGELRILANAAKRSAKFTYDQHQSMMGALAKDSPNSVPYYQLEVNPSIFGTASSDVRSKADQIISQPSKP